MEAIFIRPKNIFQAEDKTTHSRVWQPLSLITCAAILRKKGFQVRVIDEQVKVISDSQIQNLAENFDFVFITSSALDRWQCPPLNISRYIFLLKNFSRLNKNVFALGYHGTVDPEAILKNTGAKGVIRGEPEEIIRHIVDGQNLDSIKGLSYINSKVTIVHNPAGDYPDISKFPIPAYDLLAQEGYSYSLMGDNFYLLETSRGCPYNCPFCVKDVMYNNGVRNKSFSQIKEELTYLVNKLNAKNIYFIDLELSNNLPLLEKISDFLIESGFSGNWSCQMRLEGITEEILKKMKKAGCNLIHIGVESGVMKTRNQIGKKWSDEVLLSKFNLIRKAKIRSLAFFILGLPSENEKEYKETIKFSLKLNPTYVSFHQYYFYPNHQTTRQNSINENLEIWKQFKDDNNKINRFIKYANICFYLRLNKILSLMFKDFSSFMQGARIFIKRIIA